MIAWLTATKISRLVLISVMCVPFGFFFENIIRAALFIIKLVWGRSGIQQLKNCRGCLVQAEMKQCFYKVLCQQLCGVPVNYLYGKMFGLFLTLC